MDQRSVVLEIVLKFERGERLNAAEQAELDAWRRRASADAGEFELMPAEEWPEEAIGGLVGQSADRVWSRIRTRLRGRVVRPWWRMTEGSLRRRWVLAGSAAAAVLVMVLAGFWRYEVQAGRSRIYTGPPTFTVSDSVHHYSVNEGQYGAEVTDSVGGGQPGR